LFLYSSAPPIGVIFLSFLAAAARAYLLYLTISIADNYEYLSLLLRLLESLIGIAAPLLCLFLK